MPRGLGSGHSSGGSSSGGSSFSSSGGSSRSIGYGRSSYHENSKAVMYRGSKIKVISSNANTFRYISFKVASTLSSLFIFSIILFIFAFSVNSGMRTSLENRIIKIEQDYNYYQDMIEIAEYNRDQGDDSYFTTATITDIVEDYGKYFYRYEYSKEYPPTSPFYGSPTNIKYEGYTYAIYSEEEIANYNIGDSVIIVLNESKYDADFWTDNVNYDYKYSTLEDDGEYNHVEGQLNIFDKRTAILITIVVVFNGTLLLVFLLKLKKDDIKSLQDQTSKNLGTNQTTPSTYSSSGYTTSGHSDDGCFDCDLNNEYNKNLTNIKNRNKAKYCMYCGYQTTDDAKKCPDCGAKLE